MTLQLASLDEFVRWSDSPIANAGRADAILTAASTLVRAFKGGAWVDAGVPDVSEVELATARTVVLNVAYRTYHNPNGAKSTQLEEFSESVADWAAFGCALTEQDKEQLSSMRASGGLGTLGTTRGRVEMPAARTS